MDFPENCAKILARLHEYGYDAYAVGGCVRDSLSGRVPHDWDICTSALPEETAAIFSAPPFGVRTGNGLRHGTVTVFPSDDPHTEYEITTFRTEGAYTDHRRPDAVSFVRTPTDDLARRDFTINAMAACPADPYHPACLLDPFGGQRDLADGIIRAVGDAETRFREDALRILRGIRFAARFGFRIEAETAAAMHICAPLLDWIAPERIGDELRGILAGEHCGALLTQFADITGRLLPGCDAAGAEKLFADATADARLPLLLHACAPDSAREMLLRYGFGASAAEECALLLTEADAPLMSHADLCRIADRFGKERTPLYFAFRRALVPQDARLSSAEAETAALFAPGCCYNVATLAVGGRDLIAAGIRPGVLLGMILRALADSVIAGEVPNEPAALRAAAMRIQSSSSPSEF